MRCSAMIAALAVLLALLVSTQPAQAQMLRCQWKNYQTAVSQDDRLEKFNQQIQGTMVDFTHHHGQDNRIASSILGRPRDCYVYLPPGYSPNCAYSLIIWLHGAFGDEQVCLGTALKRFDKMIANGQCPPVIMAFPDGTRDGESSVRAQHGFFVNGINDRHADFLIDELVPFLESRFLIRPERKAHAIAGISAGGYGALSLGIRRRDYFGVTAGLGAPANLRFSTPNERLFANFKPKRYRWRQRIADDAPAGRYFLFFTLKASQIIQYAFGSGDGAVANVAQSNPADVLIRTNLQPGELDIFLHYPGMDNFNFDAQNESFIWLAKQRGICVNSAKSPFGQHWFGYFRKYQPKLYCWMAHHLLPPVEVPSSQVGCSACSLSQGSLQPVEVVDEPMPLMTPADK